MPEMAHKSLVGNLEGMVVLMLGFKPGSSGIRRRQELAVRFIDQLLGTHMLAVLMGLPGPSLQERQERAGIAADALIAALR